MARFGLVPLVAVAGLVVMSADSQACQKAARYRVYSPVTWHPAPVPAPAPAQINVYVPPAQAMRNVNLSVSAPQPVVDRRPEIRVGSEINVDVLFLKNEGGYVFLKYAGVKQRCQVTRWEPEKVAFVVPHLDIDDEVSATIEIVRADGEPMKSIDVRLYSSVLIQSPQTLAGN